ncbi:hypothetical protein ACFY7C_00300 [Streptomyces sp. NPDC012769]|uniref:hypothetical protein n=1 Tax=Streptomyces sp. NPDC012769 TaxID=3364848 RepID=UPI0036806636
MRGGGRRLTALTLWELELIVSSQDLAERGHRLKILGGPLSGIYDPQGAGKVLFVVVAAMAEVKPEFIHERTLIGLDTAASNGNHGGRPPGRRRHPSTTAWPSSPNSPRPTSACPCRTSTAPCSTTTPAMATTT